MDTFNSPPVTIVVVDPRVADYASLAQLATTDRWKVHFLRSGRHALRLVEYVSADLWIVNVRLPDMSGLDVVEMLHPLLGGSDVFMIADEYREEDETRALALGVATFLCKPFEAACLRQWSPRHSTPFT